MYLPWIPQDIWNAVYTKNQIITTVTLVYEWPLVTLTQRAEPRAKRVKQKVKENYSPAFKPQWVSRAGCQNCFGLITPLCFPFSPHLSWNAWTVTLCLSHHCILRVWGQTACLYSPTGPQLERECALGASAEPDLDDFFFFFWTFELILKRHRTLGKLRSRYRYFACETDVDYCGGEGRWQ